jgi:hypothetical protein
MPAIAWIGVMVTSVSTSRASGGMVSMAVPPPSVVTATTPPEVGTWTVLAPVVASVGATVSGLPATVKSKVRVGVLPGPVGPVLPVLPTPPLPLPHAESSASAITTARSSHLNP